MCVCMCVYTLCIYVHVCSVRSTLCNPMDCSPPGSSVYKILHPGKNTGVGFHFLLQGIFPTLYIYTLNNIYIYNMYIYILNNIYYKVYIYYNYNHLNILLYEYIFK